jgi:hypothetical protein
MALSNVVNNVFEEEEDSLEANRHRFDWAAAARGGTLIYFEDCDAFKWDSSPIALLMLLFVPPPKTWAAATTDVLVEEAFGGVCNLRNKLELVGSMLMHYFRGVHCKKL